MKVIRKTILDKVNDALKVDPKNIIRIEMSMPEFEQFIVECKKNTSCCFDFANIVYDTKEDYSGSHVVYKGVCIQTHSSYSD